MLHVIRLYLYTFFILVLCNIEFVYVQEPNHKIKQQKIEEIDQDDEKLSKEIWSSCSLFYQNIIDITGFYFTGGIMNSDQFYERMLYECGKSFFQIIRLLASYGPRMLQNPQITWKQKLQKTSYIVSFFIVFLIWSQEMYKYKKNNYHNHNDGSNGYYRNISNRSYDASCEQYRPRMPDWS